MLALHPELVRRDRIADDAATAKADLGGRPGAARAHSRERCPLAAVRRQRRDRKAVSECRGRPAGVGAPDGVRALMKLGVVQPRAHAAPNDERNVADAVAYVAEAAAGGADVVVFPETYPGPLTTPLRFDPGPSLQDAAARHGVYVVYGALEPIDGDPRAAYNLICLATPTGERTVAYRRTHPPGAVDLLGRDDLGLRLRRRRRAAACRRNGVRRVRLRDVQRGLRPRGCRAASRSKGAEVIFIPAGNDKKRLYETWRTLIFARAIENLAIVVTTQNIYGDERGLAMVASPEAILLEATAARRALRGRRARPRAAAARGDRPDRMRPTPLGQARAAHAVAAARALRAALERRPRPDLMRRDV